MNALIALTLTGILSAAPAAAHNKTSPVTPPARATLAAQVEHAGAEVAANLALRQPGDDSLKNGAIIGGVVVGVGMGAFLYTLCRALDDTGGDANCAGPAVMWGAIFGAGGAAVGAGVDALFDQKTLPGRVSPVGRTGKTQPGRVFKVGFKF
jgi:hypothetical protein